MANVKFTEFPSAATVGGTDIIPIVQGGVNKKATGAVFSTYIGSAFVALTGNQTIAGFKTFSSQLISSVADGTAPFSVASTTKVTNLNADLLDGLSSAAFQTVLTNPITGTGTTNYLPKFTGASALGNSQLFDNGTNVGIGTASPASLFHASKTYSAPTGGIDSNIQILASNTSGASGLGMLASNSSVSFLHFGDTDSANIGQIAYTHANDNMLFVANGAERMRITSAGNVGIGTSSPSALLDVRGNANFRGSLFGVTLAPTATGGDIYLYEGNVPKIYIQSAGTTVFNAGNVLIGTTTDAGYKLDVNGTARVQSELRIQKNGSALTLSSNDVNGNFIGFSTISSNTGYIGNAYHLFGSPYNNNTDLGIRAENNLILSSGAGTNFLTLASSGAATFSSSVTVGNFTTTQINALTPAAGMVVFNTTLATLCFYDGSGWRKVSHSAM